MKKIASIIMCAVLIFSALPLTLTASAWSVPSESAFAAKLSQLKTKYPNGGVYSGTYYENGTAKAWTCFGYACQMMYEVFGIKYYNDGFYNKRDYNFGTIYAGDIIRLNAGYGPDTHSVFVTKVTSSRVYFTDGNYNNKNGIRWDASYSISELKSRFTYKVHVPGNYLTGGGSASQTTTTKYYELKNAAYGKYLNIYGNGSANNTNVDIYDRDQTSGQYFSITQSGSGYVISPKCSSGVVNIYGNNPQNLANVCLWQATGHSTQSWKFEKISGNKYVIRSVYNNNFVLTAVGNYNNANVRVQNYQAGNTAQQWEISPDPFPNQAVGHSCNFSGGYAYDTASHPHYKCYKCSICQKVNPNTNEPQKKAGCETCYPKVIGDINGDNVANLTDARISMQRISSGTAFSDAEKKLLDFDGDNIVSLSDIRAFVVSIAQGN